MYIFDDEINCIFLAMLELGKVTSEPYTDPNTMQKHGVTFSNLERMFYTSDRLITYDSFNDSLRFHAVDFSLPSGLDEIYALREPDSLTLMHLQRNNAEITPSNGIKTTTGFWWKSYTKLDGSG
jgi:hypothetical protein